MKKNKNSSTIIKVYGNNNSIYINDGSKASNKTSKKSWLQALGKLIRSVFVNISVLLIEIFTKLG